MNRDDKACLDPEALLGYVDDELPATERGRVEAGLRDDVSAARQVAQLRSIAGALDAPHPDFRGVDLAAAVRARIAQEDAALPPRRADGLLRGLRSVWVSAAAVIALGVVVQHSRQQDDDHFRAKSAGTRSTEAQRWTGVQLQRVAEDGKLEPAPAQIAAGDRLLFSYTNLGARPYAFVSIFGVDASGEVRWYYPAYERADSDPTSVPIAPGGTTVLPDEIGHDYAPGPLAVHALFTQHPLRVSEVERWLRAPEVPLAERVGRDAVVRTTRLRVTPRTQRISELECESAPSRLGCALRSGARPQIPSPEP